MSNSQGGPQGPPSPISRKRSSTSSKTYTPPYRSLKWTSKGLFILDQRELPEKKTFLKLETIADACHAIKTLAVRGAPLIGATAALALANYARENPSRTLLKKALGKLAKTRPTAVNLFFALDKMREVLERDSWKKDIVTEGIKIWKDEETRSLAIAAHGQALLKDTMTVTTYCNTGALAAPGLGTALGIIIKAHLDGKKIHVLVPETRPLLQGARLTAWELSQWKIPYTLLTESALASFVKTLDAVFVGADRIAANGDSANKVGTYGLAIMAKYHKVPFYIAAPSSTIDFTLKDASLIPIEERSANEVTSFRTCSSAPRNAKVANPAFDITPAKLITGIITEEGVHRPPYTKSLRR